MRLRNDGRNDVTILSQKFLRQGDGEVRDRATVFGERIEHLIHLLGDPRPDLADVLGILNATGFKRKRLRIKDGCRHTRHRGVTRLAGKMDDLGTARDICSRRIDQHRSSKVIGILPHEQHTGFLIIDTGPSSTMRSSRCQYHRGGKRNFRRLLQCDQGFKFVDEIGHTLFTDICRSKRPIPSRGTCERQNRIVRSVTGF